MFGRVSKQDIESAAEVEQRSSPRSLQRRSAHCLRRSYFLEHSFACFRFCFVRIALTVGLTDWRYAFTRALSVLPVCCLQHIFRWRFCQDRAQSHVVVSGKSFLAKQEACRPWGKGRFGSGEKRRCYTNQAQSHDSERKTLELIQQQNSLRRRLFLYPC